MLRAALGLVLVLSSSAAHASAILYATAATTGEITSYCLGAGGGLAIDPFERVATGGRAPSRLIVLSSQPDPAMPLKQFLYVAQNDRVQVFEIGPRGGLTARGRIPAQPIVSDPQSGLSNMNPHDIVIGQAPDGSGPVIYVPQRADNRIAAFPIDPATGLSTVPTQANQCVVGDKPSGVVCDPTNPAAACLPTCQANHCVVGTERTGMDCDLANPNTCGPTLPCELAPISDAHGSSCVLGPIPSDWEDVLAANGLVYAARSASRGEVIAYQLNPDGNFADGVLVVNEAVAPPNEAVGPNGKSMCTRRRGCTTGVPCTSDANCVQAGTACGAGVCVETSGPECNNNSDCPGTQTCQAIGPCDQNNQVYRVSSADCTAPIDLLDSSGNLIVNQAGNPVSKRSQIQPYSLRRRLNGLSALNRLRDLFPEGSSNLPPDMLYVSERFRKAISALELCPNAFTPDCDPTTGTFFKGPDALVAEVEAALSNTCPAGGFFSKP